MHRLRVEIEGFCDFVYANAAAVHRVLEFELASNFAEDRQVPRVPGVVERFGHVVLPGGVEVTTTLEPTTDTALENGARWPRWVVPPTGADAWIELQRAVRELGRPPACERDPEAWWLGGRLRKVDAVRAAAAVEACSWCPVRELCASYALAAGERHGVWGGTRPADRGWS